MLRGAIPEYPPILQGTLEQQMVQLREYIIRNIEAMQRDLTASGGTIYVENGVAYVTINGSTMTLQEFIENYVSEDGNTINITVNANIETNPDLQEKTVTITANGTQTVIPDSDKDGLSSVEIEVNVPQGSPPTGTITIITNGTHDVANYATANVQVPSTATNLQSKSFTPTAAGTTVTPDSDYDGLSQVVVAGDADLIAGNIKKDIVIFGVTGTYEGSGGSTVNGSLIEITCSSNIDAVTAEINGNTYTAYIDTSTHKAYVTIPRTDTTVARTCTLRGFYNGTQVTSSYVSMAAGISYYTASLSTSEYLYNNGIWYGITNPTWTYGDLDPISSVSQQSDRIIFYKGLQYTTNFVLGQRFDMHGYTNYEVEFSTGETGVFRTGTNGSFVRMEQSAYQNDCFISPGHSANHVRLATTDGTTSFNNATLSVSLTLDSGSSNTFTIHSIKFV